MILSSELANDTSKILAVLQSYNMENLLQLTDKWSIIVDKKITAEELRLSIINQFYSLRALGYTISCLPDYKVLSYEEHLYIVQGSEVWRYDIPVTSAQVSGWYQAVDVVDLYIEWINVEAYHGKLQSIGTSYLSGLLDPVKHIIYVTDMDDFFQGKLCTGAEAVRIKRKILLN